MTKPSAQTHHPRGTETILLVEDEEALRQLICVMLERGGYCVLEAVDGAQALEICRKCDAPIDLLLTDVVMPKMNGQALARQVGELSPKTRVLFMSGHPQSVIATNGLLEQGADLLLKPFTRDSLLAKVREILDRSVS
jgi:DNA-binding response OmpR family regulator